MEKEQTQLEWIKEGFFEKKGFPKFVFLFQFSLILLVTVVIEAACFYVWLKLVGLWD